MTFHPPRARREPVVDIHHGYAVEDPYRWLEDAGSPETRHFVEEETAWTRRVLDAVPGRDAMRRRLEQLLSIGTLSAPEVGRGADGGRYFYTRRDGMQNQPVLLVRDGVDGPDRALVDVNAEAPDGTLALDWFQPSRDGSLVACGTSRDGSEISTLRVVDAATGRALPERIERTRAASVAWLGDAAGFFYTRYPEPGAVPAAEEMYHRRVFFHRLGTAPDGHEDALVFAPADPTHWPNVHLSEDDRWLLIEVAQGWSRSELWLKDLRSDAPPVSLAGGRDALYAAVVHRGRLFILTNEDAPRYRVFTAEAERPHRAEWREIVPQSEGERGAVLSIMRIVGDRLVAVYEQDATSRLRLFGLDGRPEHEVPLPGLGTLTGLGGAPDDPEAFFGFHSFTVPPSVYRIDVRTSAAPALWQGVAAPIDPARFETRQEFFISRDGTRVPMFLVSRKGLEPDGATPTLLYGYGGFNVSLTPEFRRSLFLWLERGGLFAFANLRGGGEYGEAWHKAGMLGSKQNVFDDFIAAAEHLIRQGWTDAEHLAIQGGSNGGLLVGAAVTQRPELFRAAVCQVPLLDMLRYHRFQIARLWIPEYGSSDDPEQFEWLFQYSPYQHVREGVVYPAMLFMTADTDTRVDPLHAKKMVARLQAEAANGDDPQRPILLRIDAKAGHGAGKPLSKLIDESVDLWSFLVWQLGVGTEKGEGADRGIESKREG